MKCDKHPKYKGKKKPTNNCVDCLKLYLSLQKPRFLKQTKIIESKKIYNRKKVKNVHS